MKTTLTLVVISLICMSQLAVSLSFLWLICIKTFSLLTSLALVYILIFCWDLLLECKKILQIRTQTAITSQLYSQTIFKHWEHNFYNFHTQTIWVPLVNSVPSLLIKLTGLLLARVTQYSSNLRPVSAPGQEL